jgi:hypothetical protein
MVEEESARSLAVLLLVSPHHPAFDRGLACVQWALSKGCRIYLYGLDEGVLSLRRPEVQKLGAEEVQIFGCAYAAEQRHLPLEASVTYGGLGLLHNLLATCDYFWSVDEWFDEKDVADHLQ